MDKIDASEVWVVGRQTTTKLHEVSINTAGS